jgi:hypothetical protein
VPLPAPAPGLVLAYTFLWRDQKATGAETGQKARPCVIVVAVRDETGDTAVYVAPITHSKPVDPVGAVSLPQAVKRRLGLDAQPSWIITTELNRFIWPGYDLAPISRENPDTYAWGFLPGSIFAAVKRSILANRHRQRLAVTGRD